MRSRTYFDSSLGWIIRSEVWEADQAPFTVIMDQQDPGNDIDRVGLVSLFNQNDALILVKELFDAIKEANDYEDQFKNQKNKASRQDCMRTLMQMTDGAQLHYEDSSQSEHD